MGHARRIDDPNPSSTMGIKANIHRLWSTLITSEVLDARRRGETTEAYGAIRRKPASAKPAPAKAGGGGRSDRRQRRPSALLRAMSLSNGR
jgi:hypothetical protein